MLVVALRNQKNNTSTKKFTKIKLSYKTNITTTTKTTAITAPTTVPPETEELFDPPPDFDEPDPPEELPGGGSTYPIFLFPSTTRFTLELHW